MLQSAIAILPISLVIAAALFSDAASFLVGPSEDTGPPLKFPKKIYTLSEVVNDERDLPEKSDFYLSPEVMKSTVDGGIDESRVSVTGPRPVKELSRGKLASKLASELHALASNRSTTRRALRRRINDAMTTLVDAAVVEATPCAVQWKWITLSSKYWPRHVRTGKCSKRHRELCGGKCREKLGAINLLRWSCLESAAGDNDCASKMWLSITIENVVTGCSCQC
ncbi:noggin-like [Oscarella lobularis]|uniref:noggin-like n=1 Tax=Oscarella lobularis TaxID=121494 RepID=UPI0033141D4E